MRPKTLRILWCALTVGAVVSLVGCSHKADEETTDTKAAPSSSNSSSKSSMQAKPKVMDPQ